MIRGLGLAGQTERQRDLSDIAGSWVEAPAFDRAVAEQDWIDQGLWK